MKTVEILNYNEKENTLFVANEVLDLIRTTDLIKASSHRAFAFSYAYLVTWLYRYGKYGGTSEPINPKTIKKILGYSPDNKVVDYLIKKGGVVDQLGITEKTRDFPTGWVMNEFKEVELIYDEFDKMEMEAMGYAKQSKINKPLHAFEREGGQPGTFVSLNQTTMTPFGAFIFCMDRDDLGVNAFYTWAYFNRESYRFRLKGGVKISYKNLIDNLGFSATTLTKVMDSLKQYNMIHFQFQQAVFKIGSKEPGLATKYSTVDPYHFYDVRSKRKPKRLKVVRSQ